MLSLTVEFTDACNLRCKWCPHYTRKGRPHLREPTFLSFENWKRILDNLKEINGKKDIAIALLGEPMLHPQFNEFLRYAFKHSEADLHLFTNGTLMTKEIRKTLTSSKKLKTITISVDTYKRETYKKLKGADLLPEVIKNTKALIKERKDHPKIIISMVVAKGNYKEAKAFASYWKKILTGSYIDFDWRTKDKDEIYFKRREGGIDEEEKNLIYTVAKQMGFKEIRKYETF